MMHRISKNNLTVSIYTKFSPKKIKFSKKNLKSTQINSFSKKILLSIHFQYTFNQICHLVAI